MLARLLAPHLDELELPLRLYYRGDVVRHQPLRPGRMREYSQLGAELLGGDQAEGDEQMLTLFFDLLLAARGEAPAARGGEEHALRVVLGVAGALDEALLTAAGEQEAPDLAQRIASRERTAARRAGLADVVERGYPTDLSVLGGTAEAVSELLGLRDRLSAAYRHAGVEIEVDLAEFAAAALDPRISVGAGRRGYYDGLMFAAYAPGTALALGVGGRYDKVFRSLSGDCSAVGFSCGLDLLLELDNAEARS